MINAKGTVFKYGDNVDTDVIIPARYLNSSDPAELATHCMEDIDKDFIKTVKKGDIIVAEKNFGCGSSREHAPIAIKAAGVSCVIAETFARIFYRNAINIGPVSYTHLDVYKRQLSALWRWREPGLWLSPNVWKAISEKRPALYNVHYRLQY